MSKEYSTFVLNKDSFTANSCLENITFATDVDESMTSYVIRAKIKPETPFSEVLDLLEAGMSMAVTVNGKKRKLTLSD